MAEGVETPEHIEYVKKYKLKKISILLTQISIFIIFITLWELLSKNNIINSFIFYG